MKKRVLILGIDGYIGYPLALHLLSNGYEVSGVDNLSRRKRVSDIGANSLTPILDLTERRSVLEYYKNLFLGLTIYDLYLDPYYVKKMLEEIQPDTIIHLAEQPSAPWSMQSAHYCNKTQYENVLSTLNILWAMKEVCPNAHLIKLGSLGEYGTPNCDIPEGEVPRRCLDDVDNPLFSGADCPMKGLPFPRSPNSFYHLSKVHDTHNIIFACKTWKLTSTDIMQGVVFGLTNQSQSLLTRFDYDEYFGTAINRFCAQAISNHSLTIYGSGNQTRGFLPLKDSIQCINIAIDNPPDEGTYRTLNQFENTYSINELADMIVEAAKNFGIHSNIQHLPNPQTEVETHYYNPAHQTLFNLGYNPTTNIKSEVNSLIKTLYPYRNRVIKDVIIPKTK